MDSIVAWNKNQLITRIAMVIPIFHACESFGCHQIMGSASGPTVQRATTMEDVRKYQGRVSLATRGAAEVFRNSPQCLHFMASFWISSAQKGHFFMVFSLGIDGRRIGRHLLELPFQHFVR